MPPWGRPAGWGRGQLSPAQPGPADGRQRSGRLPGRVPGRPAGGVTGIQSAAGCEHPEHTRAGRAILARGSPLPAAARPVQPFCRETETRFGSAGRALLRGAGFACVRGVGCEDVRGRLAWRLSLPESWTRGRSLWDTGSDDARDRRGGGPAGEGEGCGKGFGPWSRRVWNHFQYSRPISSRVHPGRPAAGCARGGFGPWSRRSGAGGRSRAGWPCAPAAAPGLNLCGGPGPPALAVSPASGLRSRSRPAAARRLDAVQPPPLPPAQAETQTQGGAAAPAPPPAPRRPRLGPRGGRRNARRGDKTSRVRAGGEQTSRVRAGGSAQAPPGGSPPPAPARVVCERRRPRKTAGPKQPRRECVAPGAGPHSARRRPGTFAFPAAAAASAKTAAAPVAARPPRRVGRGGGSPRARGGSASESRPSRDRVTGSRGSRGGPARTRAGPRLAPDPGGRARVRDGGVRHARRIRSVCARVRLRASCVRACVRACVRMLVRVFRWVSGRGRGCRVPAPHACAPAFVHMQARTPI